MKECVFWGRSYIIPNVDTVVLGGTSYAHDWDTVPAKNETERILHDIYEVFPSMRDAHIVSGSR
jgi:glycine/D-amino acid oxidase-like deaminating enzyme